MHHLRSEKERLQKFLSCLTDLVQRDEFHQSLVNLQLIVSPTSDTTGQSNADSVCSSSALSASDTSSCASSNSSFSEEYFSYTPSYSPGSGGSGTQKNKQHSNFSSNSCNTGAYENTDVRN